jgi:hypothetical protein
MSRFPTRKRVVVRRHGNGWAVLELRPKKSDRIVAVLGTKRAADELVARLRRRGYGYA